MRSPEGTRLASGLMGRAVVQEWMRNRRASRPEDVSELEPLLGALPRDNQSESGQEGIFIFHLWGTRMLVPLSTSPGERAGSGMHPGASRPTQFRNIARCLFIWSSDLQWRHCYLDEKKKKNACKSNWFSTIGVNYFFPNSAIYEKNFTYLASLLLLYEL